MKSIVAFACCAFIIGCTTVQPTDTMKLGLPPHLRLSPEEMSKFQECMTEYGFAPDINNSMEHFGPPMKRPCFFACHLQAKGVEFGGTNTAMCDDAPEVPGLKQECEICVMEAADIEDKCEYAANVSFCIGRRLGPMHHMHPTPPE